MMAIEDDYLGDGVHASFDGYHIVLDLRGQDNTTRIALDPDVLNTLDRYRERVRAVLEQMTKKQSEIQE